MKNCPVCGAHAWAIARNFREVRSVAVDTAADGSYLLTPAQPYVGHVLRATSAEELVCRTCLLPLYGTRRWVATAATNLPELLWSTEELPEVSERLPDLPEVSE